VNATACILVVDDEPSIREVLEKALSAEGYRVLMACDGLEALAVLESEPVDLIVADIAMPRMNGYQLHRSVVEDPQWVTIPFLYLTAHSLDSEIRHGKELGVDDYLTKPFDIEDLRAAVRGRLRRSRQLSRQLAALSSQRQLRASAETEILCVGQLRIDPRQHGVWLDGTQIRLSNREFLLLNCLASRAGEVVSLEELVQVTHDLNVDRTEASGLLRPLIRSLRRKLGYPAGELGCIETVRGVGYQLAVPCDV
jgi:DNA-binding response OmpR family regulator